MRDEDSQFIWWVWWVWWMCSGPYLCLSQKLSAAWNTVTRDSHHHDTRDMTVTGGCRKHPTNIHQTHQTDCQCPVRIGTAADSFRTIGMREESLGDIGAEHTPRCRQDGKIAND